MDHNCFLDCEFTNFHQPELISFGLAAVSGEEFYAEVPYPRERCSEFVLETVIPLLGRDPNAVCADAYDLRVRLDTWLRLVHREKPLKICFDSDFDWRLFRDALDGRIPDFCHPRLVRSSENIELLRWDFFRKSGLPEHHALHDARALAYAFRPRSD